MAFFGVTLAVSANEGWQVTSDDDIKLARLYNSLMEQNKIKEAVELTDDKIEFVDYTWGEESRVVGKPGLLKAYSSGQTSLHNLQTDERLMFSGRGTVVFHMIFSADLELAGGKSAEDRMHGVMDFIRVLTIKNGKIFRHLDFADYDKVMPMMEKKTAELEHEKK